MGIFDKKDKKKDSELFGLFTFMNDNTKENNSEYTEKELDDLDLEDWQKNLVRSGEYEPYDFKEESPDDDSYYNEDD